MIGTYIKRDKFNQMTVCTGTNRDDLLERSERLNEQGSREIEDFVGRGAVCEDSEWSDHV